MFFCGSEIANCLPWNLTGIVWVGLVKLNTGEQSLSKNRQSYMISRVSKQMMVQARALGSAWKQLRS